jgi:hypothetical protein
MGYLLYSCSGGFPMVSDMFQVPKLERTLEGGVIVTQWGRVDGQLLRTGDRLVLGVAHADDLVLLVPRGYGRPMLGRRSKDGLIAEPTGVPASGLRWRVGGAVVAIERDLERGAVGAGQAHIVCRVEGSDIAALARARAIFCDGVRTERALIRLCSQAAVAPDTMGVQVAIAAAGDWATAEALLGQVEVGHLRFCLPEAEPLDSQRGLIVPGPWSAGVSLTEVQLGVELVSEAAVGASVLKAGGTEGDDPQLPLFGVRRTG